MLTLHDSYGAVASNVPEIDSLIGATFETLVCAVVLYLKEVANEVFELER